MRGCGGAGGPGSDSEVCDWEGIEKASWDCSIPAVVFRLCLIR